MEPFPWKDSYLALGKALERLREVLENPYEERGIIVDATLQRFEFTFELFWKTLKHFLWLEGFETNTPRSTLQKAYQAGWLGEEKIWLDMLNDRNLTSHTYDEEKANEIFDRIKVYYQVMKEVYQLLSRRT